MANEPSELGAWRARIDALDRKILAILNERGRCVLGLAPIKRRMNVPVHEPNRENEVVSNLETHNDGPLDNGAVRRIFEAIMREMRAVQEAAPASEGEAKPRGKPVDPR